MPRKSSLQSHPLWVTLIVTGKFKENLKEKIESKNVHGKSNVFIWKQKQKKRDWKTDKGQKENIKIMR